MCCLKREFCKSFTNLKSILFPLSFSTFARCLFLWCMETRLWKSNVVQTRVSLPTRVLLIPPSPQDNPSGSCESRASSGVFTVLGFPLLSYETARFLSLPPRTEGEGGVDGVSKSRLITLSREQECKWMPGCLLPFRFGLGGSGAAPFANAVVWWTASVASELWMRTFWDYLSVALNPCH